MVLCKKHKFGQKSSEVVFAGDNPKYQLNWPNYSEEQLDELEKMSKIFDEANKKPFNPSTITATVHPNAVYTSRLLNFTNLPQPVNSNKVTIISNNNGNYLIYCYIFNFNYLLLMIF
jgi:hypothetical protein